MKKIKTYIREIAIKCEYKKLAVKGWLITKLGGWTPGELRNSMLMAYNIGRNSAANDLLRFMESQYGNPQWQDNVYQKTKELGRIASKAAIRHAHDL